MKQVRKVLFVGVALIVLLAGFGWANQPDRSSNDPQVLSLNPPSFVSIAYAQEDAASFLDEEAGISAYTEVAGSLDLGDIRPEFRTIEYETADYIIGSVELPDYQESHDAHCYVHADGWVVCYYLAADPTAKILDLHHYDGETIASTKLENAIAKLLAVVGIVSFDADYYHFQHTNATKLMLIAEEYGGEENNYFDVQLPTDFLFYERSWIHTLCNDGGGDSSEMYVNDVELSYLYAGDDSCHTALGFRTVAQLPAGVFHNVEVTLGGWGSPTAYCGMAFLYREAP